MRASGRLPLHCRPGRTGLVACLLLLCVVVGAHAAGVNKCTGTDGTVTYQDSPCARDAQSATVAVDSPVQSHDGRRSDPRVRERRPASNGPGEVIILRRQHPSGGTAKGTPGPASGAVIR
jgi:hypothetical protein